MRAAIFVGAEQPLAIEDVTPLARRCLRQPRPLAGGRSGMTVAPLSADLECLAAELPLRARTVAERGRGHGAHRDVAMRRPQQEAQ
jgi:hypothetical protein